MSNIHHKSTKNLNILRVLYKEFNEKLDHEKIKYKSVIINNNKILDLICKSINSNTNNNYENKKNKEEDTNNNININNDNDKDIKSESNKPKNKSNYYDSSISHQINISIINGIFYLNDSCSTYFKDSKETEYKDELKDILNANRKKNLILQKNNYYIINGTY